MPFSMPCLILFIKESFLSNLFTGFWLYAAATGAEIALESAMPFDVSAIAFSPDGKTLASGSASGEILLWDRDKTRPNQ